MMPISNYKELIQTLKCDVEKKDQECWYIFLLMNPRNQTNAGIDIIKNFSYLNIRSNHITLFLPGLSNINGGIVPSRSAHGNEVVYEDDSFGKVFFDERGFLDTISWLEKGSGNTYRYSEDVDMVIIKYSPRLTNTNSNEAYEQNFDLRDIIVFNLDELKRQGSNVIKFIMDCREVISSSKSEEEVKQRLNGFSRNPQPLPQGIDNADEYDVFISYSRKDYVDDAGNVLRNNMLSRIKYILKANGISYWFDEDGIYSGDEFASIITRAIRNSKVFLFISSTNSNQSKWTSNEISTALEFKKTIIPFRIDESPYNDSVMMKIISLDYIEGKNVEKAMSKLLQAIKHHLPVFDLDNSHSIDQTIIVSANKMSLLQFKRMLMGLIALILIIIFMILIMSFPRKNTNEKWTKYGEFSEGLATVKNDSGRIGYIDNMGALVILCKWKTAAPFYEGVAAVENDNNFWGFIDKNGDIVIPCVWKNAWSFSEGLAQVKDYSERSGFIDKRGNMVIQCKWREAGFFKGGIAYVLNDKQLYGFINKNGIVVIPCKWSRVHYLSEGLIAVQDNNEKWGFIDTKGTEVISCMWKDTWAFSEGLARVQNAQNNKWGYINKKGELVIQCKWEYAFDFENGKACVWDDNRESLYINNKGEIIK